MNKEIIYTKSAPEPIGPYSQALKIQCTNLVFTSGQIAIDTSNGNIIDGGIQDQTRKVLENLKAVLEQAGSSFDKVIKTTVYLNDIKDFLEMNMVYNEYFKDSKPARSTIQAAALPKGALVEIDAVAMV